jgi:transcriptional regulator with XRE-family HTH domain
MKESEVSKNIRKIRIEKKLSLGDLARFTGLTKGYISKIENSDKAPPLSTLDKIAKVLKVDIGVLTAEDLDLPEEMRMCISRKGQGKMLSSGTLEGYHYEAVAYKKSGKNMEPFILQPAFDEKAIFSHEGEEFMYTIEGMHEFSYDGKIFILSEGDSVYFDSVIPHTGRSVGDKKAKVLAVMYSYRRISYEDNLLDRVAKNGTNIRLA